MIDQTFAVAVSTGICDVLWMLFQYISTYFQYISYKSCCLGSYTKPLCWTCGQLVIYSVLGGLCEPGGMEGKEDLLLVFPRERMEKDCEKKGKVGEVGAWDEFKVKEGIPEMDVVVEGSRGMILWCQRANWEPMLDGWICLLQVPKSHAASFLQPTPLGFQACSEVLAMSCKSSCVCDTGKEWKRMQALCSSRSCG